jgi:hypothetical protein
MTNSSPPCAVVSLPDINMEGQISCAQNRLIVIAPGLSTSVAKAVAAKWNELGRDAVRVVLDSDPEVCRLGFGDLEALKLLHEVAARLGTQILQQQGLRVGVIITDETTTIYSPTARLVEGGGQPGERFNAIRFDAPMVEPAHDACNTDFSSIDLYPDLLEDQDLVKVSRSLEADPPVKFDLARKVRVFNAKFEFVEFELHGLFLSRKRVQIESDLVGLAGDPKTQKLLRSSFQLIEEDSDSSGKRVTDLKRFIVNEFLISLPGYGTVVLRSKKEEFQRAVATLERYVKRFQKRLEKQLQASIDANRDALAQALLPGVLANPPKRWSRFIGQYPQPEEVERMLRAELARTFGKAEDILQSMEVKAIFKGVTYESLNDPEFIRVASEQIPSLDLLHDEYDAAKAEVVG